MKSKKLFAFKYTIMTTLVFVGALLFLVGNIYDLSTPFKISSASADSSQSVSPGRQVV